MRNQSLSWWCSLLTVGCCLCCAGCGVVAGTIIDTAVDIASYPFREYVFWGAYQYDNTWETPYVAIEEEHDPGELLLGVTISGGGSRSAYFFACVMEELSQLVATPGKSYADELDYISSVSGGSLAAAYYCLQRYAATPPRSDAEFFKKFKEAMACNFESRALLRYTVGGEMMLDIFTDYDRGDLMARVWETNRFLGKSNFQDLANAERRGAPVLIMNGTTLNHGLKFVFTTLSDRRFDNAEYFDNIRDAGFIKYAAQNYQAFRTIGFETIKSDIRPYPVAKAVVASAAVPNLLGPVTLKDRSQPDRLVHIVDGGVYDNYGIESMMQVFTHYLDQHPGKRAKIIVIDGSGYFPEDNQHSDKFSVAYYSERLMAIVWLRTKSYMEYVFQQIRGFKNKAGDYPYRNLDYDLVSLYDVLPSQQAQEPAIKDPALQTILHPHITATDFLQKLTTIQTRFSISDKDTTTIRDMVKGVVSKIKPAR